MLPFRDIDRDGRSPFFERDIDTSLELIHRKRSKHKRVKANRLPLILESDLRISLRQKRGHVERHLTRPRDKPGSLGQKLRPLVLREELSPKRPAGAHNDVAGHSAL